MHPAVELLKCLLSDWFLSFLIQTADKTGIIWMLEGVENKEEFGLAFCRWHKLGKIRRKSTTRDFSFRRGRGMEHAPSVLFLRRLAHMTNICLVWFGMLTGSWHILDVWWPLKTRRGGWLAAGEPEHLQIYTQALEGIDYELLKKETRNLSNREIAVIGEVISSLQPRNVSEAPVSLVGLISELFLYKCSL